MGNWINKLKQQQPPLPTFTPQGIQDLPPFTLLQFFGGNKVTAWYATRRALLPFSNALSHFPYSDAPCHTAIYIGMEMVLTIGPFKVLSRFTDFLTDNRRIDAIVLVEISDSIRHAMCVEALDSGDEPKIGINLPTYGFQNFLRFEPLLRWIPKTRKAICSQDAAERAEKHGYKVSLKKPHDTSPADLHLYAMHNESLRQLKTVHIGKNYKP